MFSELESLRGASSEEGQSSRKTLTEQITIELVRHSVAEEVLFSPKAQDKVSAKEAEHARSVMEELRDLGASIEAFKKVAATRPHPNVPNGPLSRTEAGPAATLFYRMRNLATGRGKRQLKRTHRLVIQRRPASRRSIRPVAARSSSRARRTPTLFELPAGTTRARDLDDPAPTIRPSAPSPARPPPRCFNA
jgi:hypothetical protein